MPYRIGLDARMFRHTGIGTYLRGLVSGFSSAVISQDKRPTLFGTMENSVPFDAPIYSVREQLLYPGVVKQCTLWHSPHYNVPFLKGKTKLVVTVHDLIHWIFRKQFLSPLQQFYAGAMMRRAVKTSDHIIAVSRNTKNDLVKHFHADPEKITVIYEGVTPEYRELPSDELDRKFAEIKTKYNLPDDFFLYVGLMKPHKNVLWLIRLFRKLRLAKKIQSSLVLVGKKDKKYPRGFEELAEFQSTGGVLHIPEIEADELITFYNRAVALVHPSLYEGFGLTILESMKCGTPVVTSRAASLSEVAGDAAILVDPIAETEMADALVKIESDAELRKTLKAKGLERVALFDWRETALQTSAVYEKVLTEY